MTTIQMPGPLRTPTIRNKMSCGKYQYYLLLLEEGYDLSLDEVKNLSIKEIYALLDDTEVDIDHDQGNHHGYD